MVKKKMNVKKEIFESLRLDLQEFTPQEYCDTCWTVLLRCDSQGFISYTGKKKDGIHSHSDDFEVEVVIYTQGTNPPSLTDVLSKKYGNFDSGAYTNGTDQNWNFFSSGWTSGYIFGSGRHFISTSYNVVNNSSQNVS